LAECAELRHCGFDPQDMVDTFSAALSHGDDAEVLNVYANYALIALGDTRFAGRLWSRAVEMRPREAQYRVNFAEMLIATGDWPNAERQISELRSIGQFGQNAVESKRLERQLRQARSRAAGRTEEVMP
jgi:Flp pilus assembly protein TadD